MAGNGDSEPVRRAGLGNGTRRLRRSDAPGNLAVADGRTDRDLAERLPHALLKRRTADVERKIQADPRCLDEADNLGDQGLIVAIGADEPCFRKAVLEIAD